MLEVGRVNLAASFSQGCLPTFADEGAFADACQSSCGRGPEQHDAMPRPAQL